MIESMASGFTYEQVVVSVDGIGEVVATIENMKRADGSYMLRALKGAMRTSDASPLTEVDLKRVADAIPDVFY